MDLRKILAENLKRERKTRGLTQADLADRAKISLPHMTEIEQCKTWVSDKTLTCLADALHVNAFELLRPAQTALTGQPPTSEEERTQQIVRLEACINTERKRLKEAADASMNHLLADFAGVSPPGSA
jgi:transcriptional regulator with XRE-family HTH domain